MYIFLSSKIISFPLKPISVLNLCSLDSLLYSRLLHSSEPNLGDNTSVSVLPLAKLRLSSRDYDRPTDLGLHVPPRSTLARARSSSGKAHFVKFGP